MQISQTSVLEGENVKLTFTREEPRGSNYEPLTITFVNEGGETTNITFKYNQRVTTRTRTINIPRYGTVTLELEESDEYRIDPANASVDLLIYPKQARPQGNLIITDQPIQPPPPPVVNEDGDEEPAPIPEVPALDRAPEVGETIRADISTIADEGGLAYDLIRYVWWYSTPIDRREVILQDGPGDSYTVLTKDTGKRIHVRAEFVTVPLGYTTSLSSKTEVVPGQLANAVTDMWLSPPQRSAGRRHLWVRRSAEGAHADHRWTQ